MSGPCLRPLDGRELKILKLESLFREVLSTLEVPDTPSTRGTPKRVARMFVDELFTGLQYDPAEDLSRVFDEPTDQLVVVRDIPFHSLCEHHLLPFYGHAHVGYVPKNKVVGLSKIARVVRGYSVQPSVQERLTTQVANALTKYLEPVGVMVVVEAAHLCMSIRGITAPGAVTMTSVVQGAFRDNEALRAEFLTLIGRSPNK